VVVGANVLKAARVAARMKRRPSAAGASDAGLRQLAAGAGAAFASTVATARLIGVERHGPLWRWAAWRVALAGAILVVRHNRSR
jgi:hypothetical protein